MHLIPCKSVQRCALLLCLAALSGCELFGWVAQGIVDDSPKLTVEAEYYGLNDETVVVLVDADLETQYRYPSAQLEVCNALSRAIAANVPGARVINPQQAVEYQQRNIYWNTMTYRELAESFKVSRLVMVELVDYRSHEPGDRTMWRGQITAELCVAEADGPNPNDAEYANTVTAAYPPDQPIGVVNANELSIRKATLDLFTLAAAGKFYDHEEERK